jgi:hypothetical protein
MLVLLWTLWVLSFNNSLLLLLTATSSSSSSSSAKDADLDLDEVLVGLAAVVVSRRAASFSSWIPCSD